MTFSHALVLVAALSAAFPAAADDINDSILSNNNTPRQIASIEESESIVILPSSENSINNQDLWQRIRNGFAMPAMEDEYVTRNQNRYAANPAYLERLFQRSSKYLYFVVNEVEKRGMPMEIALLPMIESAYNPQAYSHAKAAGLWQFIPSTGTHYGLEQTWWYDGRRDVYAATNAALDYLTMLHNMFGDWQLALAAYNWGEGAVQRAVNRNLAKGLPTDYRSLKMPAETRNYIPKLMAIRNLVATPEIYGVNLPPLENKPYFSVVSTSRHMDLDLAAELAGMSITEFLMLNPAYNKPVIAYKPERKLLVPIEKVDAFHEGLANRSGDLLSWQAYQVTKGDTLETLSAQYGANPANLSAINRLSTPRLKPGQLVLVPRRTELASVTPPVATPTKSVAPVIETASSEPTNNQPTEAPVEVAALTIAPETPKAETIISDTPPNAVIIPETNDAEIAQAAPAEAPVIVAKPRYHVVDKGDTAFNIARRYGLSVDELLQINQLKNANLNLGKRLNVLADAAPVQAKEKVSQKATSKSKPSSQYTVQSGDNASKIARRFSVAVPELLRWNGLKSNSVLKPGDDLTIFVARK